MLAIAHSTLAAAPASALSPDQILAVNDIFTTDSGVRFRYLQGNPQDNVAYVIGLDQPTPMPKKWRLDELVKAIQSKTYKKAMVQGLAVAYNDPTKADAAHGARRLSYIKELVATPAILSKEGRGKRIDEHARKLGVSPQTVVAALRDYWLGGQTTDALLTRYGEGARKRAVALTQAQAPNPDATGPANESPSEKENPRPRGRKRSDKSESYLLVGDERIRLRDAIVRTFVEKRTVTRHKLYRAVMTQLYSRLDQNGVPRLLPSRERPSRKQVTTLLDSALKLSEKGLHYMSAAEWENNNKPITGTFLQHSIGAGHIYEIDSTIVDLWLVARDNRNKIIGKATLYLVVDRYTRLIVGFHLTLDKPSWSGAMEALLSVVADKKALCQRFGAAYRPEVWVAHGVVPYAIAADRGSEYLGHESDQIAQDLRINVINMPAHMSCLKGMVECTFKLIHVSLKENSPGYEPPTNPFKRHNEKCYERDAQYTLDELTAEFIDIIAHHNLRMHPGMELDPELVLDEESPIPANIWVKDVARRSGMLRMHDETFMRHMLLPRKNAVVRQEGIFVNKCFYVCPQAFEDEWFVRAGKQRFPVRVTYDRRSVNQVYIHNPQRGPEPYPATLSPRSQHYTDYSVGEVLAVETARKKMRDAAPEHNLHLEVGLAHGSAIRAERARQATEHAVAYAAGESRKAGGSEQRQEEIADRNAKATFPDAKQSSNSPGANGTSGPAAAPVVSPPQRPKSRPPALRSASTAKPPAHTAVVEPTSAARRQMLDDFFDATDE